MSKNGKPKPSGNTHHAKKFLSTKPPHDVIRTETCDCAGGQARGECSGGYESPDR